ncbi:hypothetical protein [Candidatus Chloroploca asiatica]|uniref:DUF1269 domain-containing protein n=1 Tax=Candidatus Chloroploca asiatica TaxID=1506545 RepID=A0A2H3KJ00_9CHLR|nr:hypothetical protein [Candidatus Chloroploca asiatica]PDV97847.1 hypothetical protein A9Q02_17170 [Candidatus Chloroploca asiatica]
MSTVYLAGAFFATADGAEAALKELTSEGLFLLAAATLQADVNGKVHVKELKDMGGGKGAAIGGVIAAGLGLFAGALLIPVAVGAAMGGLAAKIGDSGFPNADLKARAAKLAPDSSVLLIAALPNDWPAIEVRLTPKATEIRGGMISSDMVATLEQDQELVRAALVKAEANSGPVSAYWSTTRR